MTYSHDWKVISADAISAGRGHRLSIHFGCACDHRCPGVGLQRLAL